MSNKTVTVNLGYTMNIGNFQNIKIDVGVTDEVHPDETFQQAIDRTYAIVEANVITKVEESYKELNTRVK